MVTAGPSIFALECNSFSGGFMRFFRVAVVTLVVSAISICAGCFSDPAKDAENKKKVEALLARLPEGWKADIEVKGDTVTIRNFTGKWIVWGTATFEIAFDEFVAEKVNFEAPGTPDGAPVVGKITLKNLRDGLSWLQFSFSYSHSLGKLELNNPHGDFSGLLAVIDRKAEPDTLLKTAKSWKIGPVKLENEVLDYSYAYFGVTSKLESVSLASASLLRWEGFEAKKLSVMSLGAEVTAIDSYGFKLAEFPDFLALVERERQKREAEGVALDSEQLDRESLQELLALCRATPFRLEGLVYNNMRIRPMTTDPIRVGTLSFDLFISPDKLQMDILGKDLEVPTAALALLGLPSSEFGLRPGDFLRGELGLGWQMQADQSKGTGTVSGSLRGLEWGVVDGSLALSWPVDPDRFPIFPSEEKYLAEGLTIGLEDLGGINKVPAILGRTRQALLDDLAAAGRSTGLEAEVGKALLPLLEKGGKVRFVVTCDPPEPLATLSQKLEAVPPTWKFAVEHTPPAAQ